MKPRKDIHDTKKQQRIDNLNVTVPVRLTPRNKHHRPFNQHFDPSYLHQYRGLLFLQVRTIRTAKPQLSSKYSPFLQHHQRNIMADEPSVDETPITFNVKSSSDAKYVLTVPLTMSVIDLKTKLAGADYAEIPPDRQRLIYSGRVLKDADMLSTYKIKEGNTVHLVKGAASNQRQNPASQGAASASGAGSQPPSGVPTNIAAGTGRDPLAGLTGARYAGYTQMPNANMFGPDGGVSSLFWPYLFTINISTDGPTSRPRTHGLYA